jgi:hypothetical protein
MIQICYAEGRHRRARPSNAAHRRAPPIQRGARRRILKCHSNRAVYLWFYVLTRECIERQRRRPLARTSS